MDVTDILRDRMREPVGLERMATFSVIAHGLVIALMLFGPRLMGPRGSEMPHSIMVVNLGGGPLGPQSGGLTAEGAKPIQAVKPPEETRPEPARPPAARTPEMTIPAAKAKPTKAAPAPVV